MKNLIWRAVAWVACRPAVTDWLIRTAQRRPYLHIGDYMSRWWLIPFAWGLPISIRVHHILRPDADPYLHDHPWPWRTIVLRGWYIEEDEQGRMIPRVRGATRVARAETLHRIDHVCEAGAVTLFVMYGRQKQDWGFMVGNPARKVSFRHYRSPNLRGELCTTVSDTPANARG